MALHKLPKQYHPDFRLPNKKPTGGVDLNKSDELVSCADSILLFNDRGNPLNDNFGGVWTEQGVDTPLTYQIADSNLAYGRADTDKNGNYLQSSENGSDNGLDPFFIVSIYTVLKAPTGSSEAVFSYATTATSGSPTTLLTSQNTTHLRYFFRGAYNYTDIPTQVGKKHLFIHRNDGVNQDYYDSAKGVWESFSGYIGTASASNRIYIGSGYNSQLPIATEFFAFGHGNVPSLAYFKDLARNPYKFLKPKQAPIYFTSDAGGGGGTQQALTLEQVQQLNESGLIGLLSDQHVALETVEQVNQSSLSAITLNNALASIQVEQLNQSNTLSIQQIAGQNLTLEATEQLNESNTLTASQLAAITAEITEQVNQSSLGGIVSASAVLLEVTEQQNQSSTININQTDGQLLALVAVEQVNETVTVLATQVNSLTLNDSEQINQSTAISLTQLATLSGSAVEQINQTNLLNIIQTGDLTSLKGIKFEPVSKVFELTEITKTYTLEEI